jgi:hypothetical protein
MDVVLIDWFTVVVAAALNLFIGFVWYSKWLFGPFMKEAKPHRFAMVFTVINSLVIAWFLAFFEGYLGVTTVTDGMFVGFSLWLGFVATTQIAPVIWTKQPVKLFFIDTGFKLLSFLVMGGIIGA